MKEIKKITGNIHLPHSPKNETKMCKVFDKYSTRYAITRETGSNDNPHYHFYIECEIKDIYVKELLQKEFPEIKQKHLKSENTNKDGSKRGWERRISVKEIIPKKPTLSNDDEALLIQYYIYKDVEIDKWKPITKNITIEEVLNGQNQYYKLIKAKEDVIKVLKKNQKEKNKSENLIEEYEKLLKDKTQYMGVDGKPVLIDLDIEDAVTVVLEDKIKSNKCMNRNVQFNIIQTLLIRNNKKYKQEYKQKLIDDLKI